MINNHSIPTHCDVVIIGGGPAGLACATQLRKIGVESVVVLEREAQAGGIPRHCGHPPFGMREFTRIMTGPSYARALVDKAEDEGVKIFLNISVVSIHPEGMLTLSGDAGMMSITAKRVVISTGIRETPRSARFVSGQRPLGIATTGALQSMVYLKGHYPFKAPVIIGSELVSFSALLTCKKMAIKPVAMIEENNRITAYKIATLLAAWQQVPIKLNTQLIEIEGKDRVTGVKLKNHGGDIEHIVCDGVLFSGQFTPETSLLRMGHLQVDASSGIPIVDQHGECSDSQYFATGNVLHPVETAGWCWQEGKKLAQNVSLSLSQESLVAESGIKGTVIKGTAIKASAIEEFVEKDPVKIEAVLDIELKTPLIKYVTPQKINTAALAQTEVCLQLRFNKAATGELLIKQQQDTLVVKQGNFLPERRILIKLPVLRNTTTAIEMHFREH